jgi:hypothetical protein
MHVEMIRRGRDRPLLENDLVELDAHYVPKPDDVLYSTELLELPKARRTAFHHGRHDVSVSAGHDVVFFEAFVHLLHRLHSTIASSCRTTPQRCAPPPAGRTLGSRSSCHADGSR